MAEQAEQLSTDTVSRPQRGRFITFEGIEGAGKSRVVKHVAERLRAAGHSVQLTAEPGGTPLAQAIRRFILQPNKTFLGLKATELAEAESWPLTSLSTIDELALYMADLGGERLPMSELMLFMAARAQHVHQILGWLAAGNVVICDRYEDSTRAYQGAGRGIDDETIEHLNSIASGGLRADLTLLLDVLVELGLERRQAATSEGGELNHLDQELVEFYERARARFLALAEAEPNRFVVLDAAQTPQDVAEEAWQAVSARLQTPRES